MQRIEAWFQGEHEYDLSDVSINEDKRLVVIDVLGGAIVR
jgi:hypothetical protein